MSKLCVFLAAAVALSGCFLVGPNYRRPPIDTPGSWRFEETEARDTANTMWWKEFHDPVLDELVEAALKENKDIRIAGARIEEFLGRYRTTRAALFPQVGGGALAAKRDISRYVTPSWPPGTANPYWDYQTFLNASWQIDMWGQLRRATEAARADLLATDEFRRVVVLTVVTVVASAYTDLRDLDKQLEIARATVESRAHSLELFRLRFGRGLISEVDLRQAESEYEAAVATIPALEKQIAFQEDTLSFLVGRNPSAIPRGNSLDGLHLPEVPEGLPSQLLERRPDIRLAEENLIAANARIGVAKAAYFPTISLTGVYGLESNDLSNLFSGPARMWNFVGSLAGPIFTAGAIAGQVKTAESIQQESLFRYQQVIQEAFREVEDALIDQRKSREELQAQRQQVDALQRYADLARVRYENGYTSYLEVLDAERSLFTAQLLLTETQGNLFRALVNLYKAMGGGWVVQATNLTGG